MPPFDATAAPSQALIDPFGREIDYVRLSVTDRCDLRCTYCMAEHQTFLPKAEVLSIEELDRLASALINLGVKKLRLTGGEPLVRKGFMTLVEKLSRHLRSGALQELTLTTNGTQLQAHAADLARLGVKRINVSIDSLDPDRFRAITRGGDLARVLAGVEAARAAGLKVKINTVALARDNLSELPALIQWAHGQGHDITLIEAMPLGETGEDRSDQYVSLKALEAEFASYWRLTPLSHRTPGPARYVRVEDTGSRLGFITPLTHNFCEACNRVRVTCTGTMFMCLGQDDQIDLRAPLRASNDDSLLIAAIREAIAHKPKGHDFDAERLDTPALSRPMAMTGG